MFKIIKQTSIAGAGHVARLISTLFLLKMIAVYYGPQGLGFWANFISLMTVATNLAGGGILTGIIKYVSEYQHTPNQQAQFINSSLIYASIFSVLTLIIGFVYRDALSTIIFGSKIYSFWVIIFLAAQFLLAFNNVFFGMINGMRHQTTYALIIVIGNLLAVISILILLPYRNEFALLFTIMSPALCPLIPIIFCIFLIKNYVPVYHFSLYRQNLIGNFRKLFQFSLMIMFSTLCFPLVEIVIRNQLIEHVSLQAAGFWAAITRLSSAGMSFISLYLMMYFVPEISSEANHRVIYLKACQCMKGLMMGMLFVIMFFTLIGKHIISALYSSDFTVITNWMLLHLVGDLFRVMSWVIGFIIIAKAKTKLYIAGELIQGSLFLIMASHLIQQTNSVLSVTIAYVICSIVYFILIFGIFLYFFKYKLNYENNGRSILL